MSSLIGNVPREKLKELIDKHGDVLLQDPDRCEGLLKDHCGAFRKEISALVGALDERIPLELKSSWQTAMTPEAMRARLVQRLEENRGLAPDVAAWAVDAWSHALGVGLGRTSERVEEASVVNHVPPIAGGPSVADRVASDRPGGGAAAAVAKGPALTPGKKGGIAAAAALAVAVAGYAMFHRQPPPPPPGPANGGSSASGNTGGNSGGGSTAPTTPKPDAGKVADGSGTGSSVPGNSGSNSGSGSPSAGRSIPASGGSSSTPSGSTPGSATVPPPAPAALLLPAGTSFAVRLDHPLNTDELKEGDLVSATVASPVTLEGSVIVPTGAVAHLRIATLSRDGKTQQLRLTLADVAAQHGRVATASEAHSFSGPELKNDQLKRGGIGGAVGAAGGFVVGKLFHHGGAGAAAGAGAGAATGALTAKPGPVKLPAETMLHFSLTAAARVQN